MGYSRAGDGADPQSDRPGRRPRGRPAVAGVRHRRFPFSHPDLCSGLEMDSLRGDLGAPGQAAGQRGDGSFGVRNGGHAAGVANLRSYGRSRGRDRHPDRGPSEALHEYRRSRRGAGHCVHRLDLSGLQLHFAETGRLVWAARDGLRPHASQLARVGHASPRSREGKGRGAGAGKIRKTNRSAAASSRHGSDDADAQAGSRACNGNIAVGRAGDGGDRSRGIGANSRGDSHLPAGRSSRGGGLSQPCRVPVLQIGPARTEA